MCKLSLSCIVWNNRQRHQAYRASGQCTTAIRTPRRLYAHQVRTCHQIEKTHPTLRYHPWTSWVDSFAAIIAPNKDLWEYRRRRRLVVIKQVCLVENESPLNIKVDPVVVQFEAIQQVPVCFSPTFDSRVRRVDVRGQYGRSLDITGAVDVTLQDIHARLR